VLRKRVILLVPLLALFSFVATAEQRAVAAADTTPPITTITSGPAAGSTDTDGNVTFTYRATDNVGVEGFDYRLINRTKYPTYGQFNPEWQYGEYGPSSGSKTFSNLANGQYTFEVIAHDAAQNYTYPWPTRTFTVNTTSSGGSWTSCSNTGNHITPGEDIDAIVNNDPRDTATRFCVHAGTYQVSEVARLRAGDKLDAQPGTKTTVDTATKPTPVVKLVGSGPDSLLRPEGTGISITWVDLSGARGTGPGSGAIAAGSAGSDFLVQYARIHNNDSAGITNMKGHILDSEFFSNSQASGSIGFNASAVKGNTEYEAGRLYVHDEQGNGLWCDNGCDNDPALEVPEFQCQDADESAPSSFCVYDSVVVNNDRAGIRYENSPNQAVFYNNEVHGNGSSANRGGIDIRDSQNATVRSNVFGPATIAGVSYPGNAERIGIRATDSGRSDRVNLENVDVLNNDMNGERIITCGGPVVCSGNTEVGSR